MNNTMLAHGFRWMLLPVSWLYVLAICARNWLYDRHLFRMERVNVPIIAVGNLTAGGTGKTPVVEMLVRHFLQQGKRVSVVSRGYKRSTQGSFIVSDGRMIHGTATTSGDEPYQIARKFPAVPVIVDHDRVRGAKLAVGQFAPEVIVSDDGFQHRKLFRDLDIVLLDDRVLSSSFLPAGTMREPVSSLRRAGVVGLTKTTSPDQLAVLAGKNTNAPVFRIEFRPVCIRSLGEGRIKELPELTGTSCLAVCGIGNPEGFHTTLTSSGLTVIDLITYPDHHRYSIADIREIERRFENGNAEIIVTTEKDAVRILSPEISGFSSLSQRWYFLEIEASIHAGQSDFFRRVDTVIESAIC